MKKLELNKLQARFAELVLQYMKDEDLTQAELSKIIGIQQSHLNALLNKKTNRTLTSYYVLKFIQFGIFSPAEIRVREWENSKEESEFWKYAEQEYKKFILLKEYERLKNFGINLLDLTKSINPKEDIRD